MGGARSSLRDCLIRLSLALDVYTESFSLVRKIGSLHRLCRLADLKFDAVVLKEICRHGSLNREIYVFGNVSGAFQCADDIQFRRDDPN